MSDIVGSTALRTTIGESAFTALRESHDALAADLVEACGGHVVRFTGDGLLVAFPSAGQALEYASTFCPAVERLDDGHGRLAVRVGISLGDAIDVDGDLDGPALVEASRLCDAASPGQVLCTELVRRASRSDDGDFGETVMMPMKGLGDVQVRALTRRVVDRAPTGLAISVLGPLRVSRGGRRLDIGGTKEQRVLAVLAAAHGGLVLVDELVEALWYDSPPRTAERSLHTYVARLRKAVEPSRQRGAPPRVIVTEGKGYRLKASDDTLDSVRFDRLTTIARESISAGHALRGRQLLDDALALWHGTPFQEHADVERCARESRRLEAQYELALEEVTTVRLELGDAANLVPDLEALVAQHPLREQLWANLMLALYRAGRQAEALRTFQRARATLVDELGIDPGPELHHLESRILAQDPALLSAAPGTSTPIRRLPAALDHGAARLVGRDEELGRLRAAWERAFAGTGEFVAVVGRDGVGKTRLVSELATEANDAGAFVLYAACDAADRSPVTPIDRALRDAGAQMSDLTIEPGETRGAALVRLLGLWTGGRPVLLVLDDFQLADTGTVQELADLAEWSASAPLLVVAMFRPDDNDIGDTGRGRIALGPLPREWVLEIARGYRSRWTDTEIDELVDASGGVPLAVHRYASAWAQDATRDEVHAAAERASQARIRLAASRGELADGIEGLQRLIEHRQVQLASRSDAPASLRAPYRGLEAFGAEDADLFFGREQLVAELVARVVSAPIVVVVGASGSGKSSLIGAGLLPALETGVVWDDGTWSATVVVPGRDPLAVLASIGDDRDAHDHHLVIVDQLEEVWTAVDDSAVHQEFCDRLVELSAEERVTPVLCIRGDFVDRIADHAPLAALVGANTLLVPPMTSDELHRVVVAPAQRTGLQVEPELVEAVVADVHGRPGALPLLSTALLATWERREGRTLTLRGYRAAGGVASAIAAMADGCYDALPPTAQRAARRLLLQLAGEEHGVDVRRRVPLVAIGADQPDTRRALDALVARRLVIVDGDVAEVAHEALLRDWPRLVAWLGEDRSGRQLRQRLTGAATSWVESGRDDSELYRGTRLEAASEWADGHDDDLAPLEREFLGASTAAATRELEDAHARARTEHRRSRRLRGALVGIAALLVVALVAGGLALRAGDRASSSAVRADANRLAGLASSEPLLKNAIVDAVEGVRLHDSAETRAGLLDALQRAPQALRVEHVKPAAWGLVQSPGPDANTLAIAGFEPRDRIYDADTLALRGSIRSDAALALLSEDLAATVQFTDADDVDGPPPYDLVVRSVDDGRAQGRYPGGSGSVPGLAGSLESRLLVATGLRSTTGANGSRIPEWYVDTWSLDTPGAPPIAHATLPLAPPVNRRPAVTISPDGQTVYVGRATSPLYVLDARTLEQRGELPGSGTFDGVAVSGDARRFVAVDGNALDVLDTETGERVARVAEPLTTPMNGFGLDATGTLLMVGGVNGSFALWSLANPAAPVRTLELQGQRDAIVGSVSPDGRDLWTASLDGSLIRWDIAGTRGLVPQVDALTTIVPPGSTPRGAISSPDGLLQVVQYAPEVGVFLRDFSAGTVRRIDFEVRDDVVMAAFSPDNTAFFTISPHRVVRRFDVATGRLTATGAIPDSHGGFFRMHVSPRGDVLVATQQGIAEFDATTLEARPSPHVTHTEGLTGELALAPDGRSAALARQVAARTPDGQMFWTAGMSENSFVFVDLVKGRERSVVHTSEHPIAFEYAPDGALAVGTASGRVLLIDPRTGSIRKSPKVVDAYVSDVLFTEHGIAVAERSGGVTLLDTQTLRPTGVHVQEPDLAFGSVLGLRGRHELLISYGSGIARSFDLRPDALLDRACSIAASGLPDRYWRQVLPDRDPVATCSEPRRSR